MSPEETSAPPRTEGIASRLAAGDPKALEECYRLLGPLVRGFLRRFVSAGDVDDLLQATFLDVWQGRRRVDPARGLEPLVFTIARRRAIDHLRRQRQVLDLGALRQLVGDDGDRVVDQLAWAGVVRSALLGLSPEQREAIELAYFHHLTQPEIAKRLGVPLGTVKARTARGLRRLAASLEGRQA